MSWVGTQASRFPRPPLSNLLVTPRDQPKHSQDIFPIPSQSCISRKPPPGRQGGRAHMLRKAEPASACETKSQHADSGPVRHTRWVSYWVQLFSCLLKFPFIAELLCSGRSSDATLPPSPKVSATLVLLPWAGSLGGSHPSCGSG